MKFTRIAAAASLLCLASSAVFAQAKAPEPDYTLGFNAAVTTDYRYRGLSQSRGKPALSAGVDYSHKSGFYLGAWASTIKWIKDDGRKVGGVDSGNANLEIDLFGGYKGEIAKDFGYDVGVLQYWYPSNKYTNVSGTSANTTELYGALTYGVVTAKYSRSMTNLFGFAAPNTNSKGSGYLDLSANFDLGNGWSVAPHIGHQKVKSFSDYSYTDYSVTVNKDLGNGLVVSGAFIGTDAGKDSAGVPWYATPVGNTTSTASKDNGRNSIVLTLKYSF